MPVLMLVAFVNFGETLVCNKITFETATEDFQKLIYIYFTLFHLWKKITSPQMGINFLRQNSVFKIVTIYLKSVSCHFWNLFCPKMKWTIDFNITILRLCNFEFAALRIIIPKFEKWCHQIKENVMCSWDGVNYFLHWKVNTR